MAPPASGSSQYQEPPVRIQPVEAIPSANQYQEPSTKPQPLRGPQLPK